MTLSQVRIQKLTGSFDFKRSRRPRTRSYRPPMPGCGSEADVSPKGLAALIHEYTPWTR